MAPPPAFVRQTQNHEDMHENQRAPPSQRSWFSASDDGATFAGRAGWHYWCERERRPTGGPTAFNANPDCIVISRSSSFFGNAFWCRGELQNVSWLDRPACRPTAVGSSSGWPSSLVVAEQCTRLRIRWPLHSCLASTTGHLPTMSCAQSSGSFHDLRGPRSATTPHRAASFRGSRSVLLGA